jgi:carbohydrate esterase-like sialic acid-specific acetylesterase
MSKLKNTGNILTNANDKYLEKYIAYVASSNSGGGTFASITGQPSDNTNLATYVSNSVAAGATTNASLLTSGILPDARLGTNVVKDPLYILATGQSNINGYNSGNGDVTVNSNVEAWNGSAWVVMQPSVLPMGMQTPFTASAKPSSNNPVWHFAKRIQEKTGRRVRVILMGWGGSAISNWVGAGTNYADILTEMTQMGNPKISYFIWAQGEADNGLTAAQYQTAFNSVISQFRAETFFPATTPIIISGVVESNYTVTAAAQRAIAAGSDPFIVYADSTGLADDGDSVHWSGISTVILGSQRYIDAVENKRFKNNILSLSTTQRNNLVTNASAIFPNSIIRDTTDGNFYQIRSGVVTGFGDALIGSTNTFTQPNVFNRDLVIGASDSGTQLLYFKDKTEAGSGSVIVVQGGTTSGLFTFQGANGGYKSRLVAGQMESQGTSAGFVVSRQDNNDTAIQLFSQSGEVNLYNNSASTIFLTNSVTTAITTISRNINDTNPVLNVTQAHASSTGDIQRWNNSVGMVASIGRSGKIVNRLTTEQQRWEYDASNYATVTVGSTGSTTFALTGTTPAFTFSQAGTFSSTLTVNSTLFATGGITTSATGTSANFFTNTISGSATSQAELLFSGASAVGLRMWERGSSNYSIVAGSSYASHIIGTQLVTEASSGVHAMMSQFVVKPLTITGGVATATDAATVYITGPSTGGTFTGWNSSLRVEGLSVYNDTTATAGHITALYLGTSTASSLITSILAIAPTINESGSASSNMIFASPFYQAVGSGGQYLLRLGTNTASNVSGTHTDKFTVTNTGKLFIAAGTTTAAPLNIPDGVAPTSPVDGDVWFVGSVMYRRIAGVTKSLTFA